jgi:hypothetical protein
MAGGRATQQVSVVPTNDGVWSVNERGARVAIAYFPSKYQAMKHAVRVAKAKRRCRVRILQPDGAVQLERDYSKPGPETNFVETP